MYIETAHEESEQAGLKLAKEEKGTLSCGPGRLSTNPPPPSPPPTHPSSETLLKEASYLKEALESTTWRIPHDIKSQWEKES